MTPVKNLLPGFAATAMGVGIARFSFTPVSALMAEQAHLTSQQITIIAAFMMAAYAIGAFAAARLARLPGGRHAIHIAFVAVTAGLLAEALTGSFWPVLAARFVMSIAGAVLMVLGPGAILSATAPPERGHAAGWIFSGVGVGVVGAGLIVAATASLPVAGAGLALFICALCLTAAGWRGWPGTEIPAARPAPGHWRIGFWGLVLAYTLDATAYIPHTVYLSDYVASELKMGAASGGMYWALFGAGGIAGAAGAAWLRRILGSQLSLEAVFAAKAAFIAVAGLSGNRVLLALSALVVGALVPGIVMLVSTRTAELAGPGQITRAWGIMTGAFAIGQFAGAAGMSAVYSQILTYRPLFSFAGLTEAAALAVIVISLRIIKPQKERLSP